MNLLKLRNLKEVPTIGDDIQAGNQFTQWQPQRKRLDHKLTLADSESFLLIQVFYNLTHIESVHGQLVECYVGRLQEWLLTPQGWGDLILNSRQVT